MIRPTCAANRNEILGDSDDWQDHGDLRLASSETAFEEITSAIARLLERRHRVLSLGGDHWITHPILHAFAQYYPNLQVLQLDAHPDLYDRFIGSNRSHACTFARVMEEKLASRLVQVGIRTMNPHQRTQADRFGVETVQMRDWHHSNPFPFDGPLYVSLDLDVVDPAFAPGVSHPEPGGFTSRELLALLQGLSVPIVGADIVELNPTRDSGGMTAGLAAKLTKELLGKMLGP